MVKFGKVVTSGRMRYMRLHVHTKEEFWDAVSKMMIAMKQKLAYKEQVNTFEEVPYSEGMPHILEEVLEWPTWEKAVENGGLKLFEGMVN